MRLLELRVPPHTVARLPVQLECRFDMEGETLYSVKWYKDGHEFYRFVPTDTPKQFNFQVHGVHVLFGIKMYALFPLTDFFDPKPDEVKEDKCLLGLERAE
ncbi:hypothetical protein FOCC_FOCC016466 [Frankliniella occidentalis]|nr:hypothetical protein FOCC_FOCC016466 [Frankliniella occidentalis]